MPSDWHDLALPIVNMVWPNGGEVLYVGETTSLLWSAINPNGSDSALGIDIWYSADSGSTWAKIAANIENDGVFEWRVPLYIGDYYVPSHLGRIKVMAFGPENFMAQAWDISDHDFCPPVDYNLLTEEERAQVDQLLANGILTEADIINKMQAVSGEDLNLGLNLAGEVTNVLPVEELNQKESTTSQTDASTTDNAPANQEETATTTNEINATSTTESVTSTQVVVPENIEPAEESTDEALPPNVVDSGIQEVPVIKEPTLDVAEIIPPEISGEVTSDEGVGTEIVEPVEI
jgi:hypothetical protein